MYETFFGLKRRPFLAVPDTESYFNLPQLEDALQEIERAMRRGEGLSLVFGPSGTGKTLLLRLLRKSLEIEYTVTLVANGHLETAKAFFQQLLYDLRQPFTGDEATELRLQLLDFARRETTPGIVLLIDEAQFLSLPVLEEIRLLMDCDDGAVPWFRAVLAGTPEFEEKLVHPRLEAFNQRVVARRYLETLTQEETFRYIAWQTRISRQSGGEEEALSEIIRNSGSGEGCRLDSPHYKESEPIFTDAAQRQIHKLTDGLPRRINQLCDAALHLAAERVVRQVDEVLVHSAWARLQQIDEDVLPFLAAESPAAESETESIEEIVARKKASFQPKAFDSTIEFGRLDDSLPGDDVAEEPILSVAEIPDDESVESVAVEPLPAAPSVYKPPYPGEDDEEEFFDGDDVLVAEVAGEAGDEIPDENDDALEDESETETPAGETALEVEEPEEFEEPGAELPFLPGGLFAGRWTPTFRRSRPGGEDAGDVPRKYQRHRLWPVRSATMGEVSFCRFASLSLTLRRFDAEDRRYGNVSTQLVFQPAHDALYFLGVAVDRMDTADKSAETEILEEVPGETVDEEIVTLVTEESIVTENEPLETEIPEEGESEAETAPTLLLEYCTEEPPMDQETLDRYGEEVLQGLPPFVRKEPNYAYQTTEYTPIEGPAVDYPDPQGNVIRLNWTGPECPEDAGVGIAYSAFFQTREAEPAPAVKLKPEAPGDKTVLRIVLTAAGSVNDSLPLLLKTTLDEAFEEVVGIGAEPISLEEAFASQKPRPVRPAPAVSVDLSGTVALVEGEFRQQIELVLKRIHAAAERIEKAAEVSEDAGTQVKQAATFVETEVRAALPNYQDMFRRLSDFQQSVSTELAAFGVLIAQAETAEATEDSENGKSERGMRERHAKLLSFPQHSRLLSKPASPAGTSQAPFDVESQENETQGKSGKSIDIKSLFR